MYQLQRKNRIKETLQLKNSDGTQADLLVVDLNIDEIADRVYKNMELIAMAQNELKKNPKGEKALEAFGNALIGTLKVIFGDQQTTRLLAFYENNYTELLLDIFPFINDVIMPPIKELKEKRKKQLVDAIRRAKQPKGMAGFLRRRKK